MQIQSVNNAPNFQANHLRTAKMITGAVKPKETTIDIYSINKADSDVINKLLLKIDLKDRKDAKAVKEKNNVNDTIRYVLTKALNLKEDSKDGVYIAVKDGKHVTGVLDYTNGGMPLMKNLMSWNGNKNDASRLNLFTEFLRGVARSNKNRNVFNAADIAVYAEPKTKGHKWLLNNGFEVPEQMKAARQRLVMQDDVISTIAKVDETLLEANTGMKINKNMKHKQVELKNLNI